MICGKDINGKMVTGSKDKACLVSTVACHVSTTIVTNIVAIFNPQP